MEKIKVGILGVSGYTGLELVKILLKHEVFELCYIANTSGEGSLLESHRALLGAVSDLKIENFDPAKIKNCRLVFLALPHEESMKIAPKLLDLGLKVVDLSADYRLSAKNYAKNYAPHLDEKNLSNAVYGLVEWNRERAKNAQLIANPGCYPTASLLGILPFAAHIEGESVFIDAKSGVSGAGKKLSATSHFVAINENMFSYQPLSHRHQVEIAEKCETLGARRLKINFVPHLSPFSRGMLVSIFARLKGEIDPILTLKNAYQNEPFIRIRNEPVEVKSTAGTHFCDIFAKTSGRDLFVSTSIDNLLRGASSQAVANANLACGLDEGLGLPRIAYVP